MAVDLSKILLVKPLPDLKRKFASENGGGEQFLRECLAGFYEYLDSRPAGTRRTTEFMKKMEALIDFAVEKRADYVQGIRRGYGDILLQFQIIREDQLRDYGFQVQQERVHRREVPIEARWRRGELQRVDYRDYETPPELMDEAHYHR